MAIKFRCPTCHELFSAQDDMAGAEFTCLMCESKCELPSPPTASSMARRNPSPGQSDESPGDDHSDGARVESPRSEDVGVPLSVAFRSRDHEDRNAVDMTPMVDVTFLLLVFFMVTAAFGLQKCYDVPAPDDTRPSTEAVTLEELQSDPQYVIVRIDRYDTFHISAAAWEMEREAPSKPDLLATLRGAKASGSPAATHMLVMASEDATNAAVITALDAGTGMGMEDVKLMTVPAEE